MRQSCKRDSVKILDTCQISVHGIMYPFFVRPLGAGLLLKHRRRTADSLPLQINVYFHAIGDLDEGYAVHAVVFIEGALNRDRRLDAELNGAFHVSDFVDRNLGSTYGYPFLLLPALCALL
jgi:hypothetical protein